MSLIIQANDRPGFVQRLAKWWREWVNARDSMAELNGYRGAEIADIARVLAVSPRDLRVLAGKWPDQSALLLRRIDESNVDPKKTEPQVLRDLQRVCTLCASKRRCERDLASRPSDPVWQDYCPNAGTFKALRAERANRNKGGQLK
jgi:hypothetical protein